MEAVQVVALSRDHVGGGIPEAQCGVRKDSLESRRKDIVFPQSLWLAGVLVGVQLTLLSYPRLPHTSCALDGGRARWHP